MGNQRARRVVVIGGGITGLTAAYRLVQASRRFDPPLEVKLLERDERLGGVIHTQRHQGLLLEEGPDAFITTKPWARALCKELGLEAQLIGTQTTPHGSFILDGNALRPIPEGFQVLAPTAFWPFVRTPLFSWKGKLRVAMDLVLPRRASNSDESFASFVTRRLGREAFERMAQPLVSSIYTADADKLSLQATMPQFLEMEERDRSIIHAMWKNRRLLRRQGVNTAKDAGARYGLFNTLRDGLGSLIDELARRLPPGCVELGMVGTGIRSRAGSDAGLPRWEIQIEGGESLAADGVCLALPAPRAGAIVRSLATAPALKLADELEQISYASSAIVNLAYRRTDVAHPLDGMGFVAPSTAGRGLLACSFSSVKFPGRSPADTVLLRAFVGGAVQAERYAASDDDMRAAVEADLEEILGIRARPFFTQMSRHPETMAQYHLGHLDRVASIEEAVAKLPGIALAGNGYRGIGMPDCVHSAEQAVQSIIEELPTA